MIQAQKLNKDTIFLNPDLIVWIEAVPDTVLTFINGNTMTVLNKPEEIIQKVVDYKRRILDGPRLK